MSDTWAFFKGLCTLLILCPIAYIDAKNYRIPNKYLILGFIVRGFILAIELLTGIFQVEVFISEFAAVLLVFLLTVVCSTLFKNKIGAGDFKLLFLMATFLGIESLWSALVASVLVAGVVSLTLILTKKKRKNEIIPLGPCFAIGTIITLVQMCSHL